MRASGAIDEATATAINDLLDEQGVLDEDGSVRSVAGTVLHADGSAIKGMLVQAFHRPVGGEQMLGVETVTNDRGKYTIGYPLPAGITKIDLFVRAYDEQTSVAVSPIIIDAGAKEVLDLTVVDPKYRGPSEFARTTEALVPQIGDATLDDLNARRRGAAGAQYRHCARECHRLDRREASGGTRPCRPRVALWPDSYREHRGIAASAAAVAVTTAAGVDRAPPSPTSFRMPPVSVPLRR